MKRKKQQTSKGRKSKAACGTTHPLVAPLAPAPQPTAPLADLTSAPAADHVRCTAGSCDPCHVTPHAWRWPVLDSDLSAKLALRRAFVDLKYMLPQKRSLPYRRQSGPDQRGRSTRKRRIDSISDWIDAFA
ncbi:hypothetical protein RvY_03148 [Ramazzottius varieornatus]|uniref:Uncharacterized protein n=1 Tax=Ramazzottius varieornatus TaxID=947166 RepID=A0A1D1UM37_RAMVA|nr:hypothetical protein RvY_03148 [Ramazzottius varieornatus]